MGLLNWIERRRRSGIRQPATWLHDTLSGATATASGETVSPDKALTLPAFFAAVRNIAEDIGKLPWIVYKRQDDGGKSRATKHYLYPLLHDSPNKLMSSMAFRQTMFLHSVLWGNAYAEIVRDKTGRVVALWPLDASRVRIEQVGKTDIKYVLPASTDTPELSFLPADIFHLAGVGNDGISGYGIVHLAREALGRGLALQKFVGLFFANSTSACGVFTYPGKLDVKAKDRLRATWPKGIPSAHKPLFLEGGMKWESMAVSPEDSQLIEVLRESVNEMARLLRIPPHMIGELTRATYSNIAEQTVAYARDTLMPWFRRFECEAQRKLLPSKSPYFTEILADAMLRGTTLERYQAHEIAIRAGWATRNEIRLLENLNPLPALDGPTGTEPVQPVSASDTLPPEPAGKP